jgi:4-aminobutyrate aminotransferase
MNGVVHVPFPDPYRPILSCNPGEDYGQAVIRYIEDEIFYRIVPPDDVAAFIVEPIQGEGGYVVPPPSFFPALRKLCDKHGILLVADEVQAGVGRTGKWWSIQNFGVEPDIITVAKGIASGVPLGITVGRRSIFSWGKGAHGNTYGGNPLACAAALATLDLVGSEYMANAQEIGQYTMDVLEEIMGRHPSIGQIRGKGLMIGVEFVKDRETREPAKKLAERISDIAFEYGLLTLTCGRSVIRIAPPLCITKAEMDESLEIFDHAIGLAEKEQ